MRAGAGVESTVGHTPVLTEIPSLRSEPYVAFALCEEVRGVFGRVGDYTPELYPAELARLGSAVQKRRREFSTGRYFARLALQALGRLPGPIATNGASRAPRWPEHVVGSISHTEDLAIAVLSERRSLASLGVDVEKVGRLQDAHDGYVFTSAERSAPRFAPRDVWTTLVFSGKESVFKAVHPLTGDMMGFLDVQLAFDCDRQTFAARYVGRNSANLFLGQGQGHFEVRGDHVITMFGLR